MAVGLAGVGHGLDAQRREAPHVLAEGAGLAAVCARGAGHRIFELDVRVDAVRAAMALDLRDREAPRASQRATRDCAARVLDGRLLLDLGAHLHQHLRLHVPVEGHDECLVVRTDAQLLDEAVILLLLAQEGVVDLEVLLALLRDSGLDIRGGGAAPAQLQCRRRHGDEQGGGEHAAGELHCVREGWRSECAGHCGWAVALHT
mmetsp:Transcript_67659/g.171729  ORF Transcript_67659/g.171729 Transcript_67659/m.171729 type:complete len:203 (-) Transcript_67659:31-639(-)